MANSTVEVYEELKSKIGEKGAKVLIEYVDNKIEKTAVTKLDLANVENSLRSELTSVENSLRSEFDKRITDLEWKMKFYFLAIGALIIFTNPKIIDLLLKILGVIK